MSSASSIGAAFCSAAVVMTAALFPSSASAMPRIAPDFAWQSSGRAVHLSDLRGHVVVVYFFATWCDPCRAEMPAFSKVAEQEAARGVRFVGVDAGGESVEQVAAFADLYDIDYDLVVDTSDTIRKAYGVSAFPTTFIVDKHGSIVFGAPGQMSAGLLKKLLAKIA